MQPSLLFVRDDLSELPRIQRDLQELGDDTRVVGAPDPGQPPCACGGDWAGAVIDLDVPADQAGATVAQLQARCPGLPIFGTARRFDDRALLVAAMVGVRGVLPWPCAALDLRALMGRSAPDPALEGTCRGFSSAALVALHAMTGQDGVLVFWRGKRAAGIEPGGSVFLESGQVVHASCDGLVGAEAAREILSWPEADTAWLAGRAGAARTVVGHWTGLLRQAAGGGDPAHGAIDNAVEVAYPEAVEKLSRLAHTPQVIAAFLLRHGEILSGSTQPGFDDGAMRRAVRSLSGVLADLVTCQPAAAGDPPPREVQSIAGGIRLVVDRIGPPEAGFQAAVAVLQAAPVSKSLRRLIRQIDRAFHRAVDRARASSQGLHRVA